MAFYNSIGYKISDFGELDVPHTDVENHNYITSGTGVKNALECGSVAQMVSHGHYIDGCRMIIPCMYIKHIFPYLPHPYSVTCLSQTVCLKPVMTYRYDFSN